MWHVFVSTNHHCVVLLACQSCRSTYSPVSSHNESKNICQCYAETEDFSDALEDLQQRRSVDVRMADAATLPMAAFGAAGMETSSAVIRGLMASHDHWRQPHRPAQQPR